MSASGRSPGFLPSALLTGTVVLVAGGSQVLAEDVLRLPGREGLALLSPLALAIVILALRRPAVLTSIRTSVCLLGAIGIGCILGTILLQETDAEDPADPSPETAFRTFAAAESGLLVKGGDLLRSLNPFVDSVEAVEAPDVERRLRAMERRFGERTARENGASLRRDRERESDRARIATFAGEHEVFFRGLYTFVVRTRLFRIFTSWAFNALLATLALSILVLLIQRWPFHRGQIGFVATHGGILVVLAGALVSTLGIDRGFLRLTEGQVSDGYWSATRGKVVPFDGGLTVSVGEVEKSYWHHLFVAFPAERIQTGFLVREGRRYTLDGGRMEIEIGRYRPEAVVEVRPVERTEGPDRPAALVTVTGPRVTTTRPLVHGGEFARWDVTDVRRTLTYRWATSDDERRRFLDTSTKAPLGEIRIQVAGEDSGPRAVERDREVVVGDASVRILDVARDVSRAERGVPFERQDLVDPGVHVEVTAEGRSSRRWVRRDRVDAASDGVRITVSWFSLLPGEIRIVDAPEADLTVVAAGAEGSIVETVREGETVRFPGHPPFVIERIFRRFGVESTVVSEDAAPAPGVVTERVGALDVIVRAGDERHEAVLVSGRGPEDRSHATATIESADGSDVRLALRAVSEREFRTRLEVRRPDGSGVRGVLRVNHPVRVDGYRLYQTDMEPGENPRWSAMQVVRDPGIPIVYAGLATTFLGVVLMLLVEPARRARSRRRLAAATAVTAGELREEVAVDVR